ncbi:MAG: C40 family peptidase [Treponema sp.]|jgi:cell wall-associated NlpC family hydrolase|nr:C40 family peptidase [Treponema sp.]
MNKHLQRGILNMALVFAMTCINCATVLRAQDASRETVSSEPTPEELALRQSVIDAGQQYLGAKYAYGKQSPVTMEFDCAGFLSYAFLKGASIKLPRSSKDIALVGTEVPPDQLRVGDVVYFDTDDRDGKKAVTHVAIYVEPNKLLHAVSRPSAKAGVQFTAFKEDRYWYSRVLGYRNLINK